MEWHVVPDHGKNSRRGTQPADESGDDRRRTEQGGGSPEYLEIMKTVCIVNYYTDIPSKVGIQGTMSLPNI